MLLPYIETQKWLRSTKYEEEEEKDFYLVTEQLEFSKDN